MMCNVDCTRVPWLRCTNWMVRMSQNYAAAWCPWLCAPWSAGGRIVSPTVHTPGTLWLSCVLTVQNFTGWIDRNPIFLFEGHAFI